MFPTRRPRKWATAPLRAFQSERQDIAAPRFPLFPSYCPAPSPSLAGFGFPLQDYAAKHGKTWLPIEAPLMNF
jgi:hypothetical protein